jgi:hypothetical protein
MELGWTWKTDKTKKIVRIYCVDDWTEFKQSGYDGATISKEVCDAFDNWVS